MYASRQLLLSIFLGAALICSAFANDWPEGYVVAENSESPDGHYGVLIEDDVDDADLDKNHFNYLVDLRTHRKLGEIKGSTYVKHQNHEGLTTLWSKDSSWCVVEYDSRFGFITSAILEPKGATFVQTDIGKKIASSLEKIVTKNQRTKEEDEGFPSARYRLGADRKLRVIAISTTDPKGVLENHGDCALFRGNFDVATKKWLMSDARPFPGKEFEGSSTALDEWENTRDHLAQDTPEQKASLFDESMNDVYRFVRVVLPPNRFEKIKQEQIAWLKKRDATKSLEEQANMTEARIQALQKLIWEF